MALAASLDADITLVTGCRPEGIVDASVYRRLVGDLRANGRRAIADLTGAPLRATLDGGVELLRLSDEELVGDGWAVSAERGALVDAAMRLCAAGARHVLVSRASSPALLVGADDVAPSVELVAPVFEALDHHGTGDSMFAATGVGLARGMELVDALRLGSAAGALNATRRGLGTGTRPEIERLARHVTVRPATRA
jgi:1-phosphofructokinase